MSKKFKLGVIGDPIEHSLSPFIHSRFSRNENINLNYLAYRVNNDELDIFIKEFFQDKEARGLNITLPHKKRAAFAISIGSPRLPNGIISLNATASLSSIKSITAVM